MTRNGGAGSAGPTVQVFGLQRSGTHFTHDVIALNFDASATKDRGGWRHAFPDERRRGLHGRKRIPTTVIERVRQEQITPVLVRKDLDHWLASIDRLPRDVAKVRGFTWDDPAATWHAFYEAWEPHAPVVRYEDFLEDFPPSLITLGMAIGLAPHSEIVPAQVPYSDDWQPEHRSRYV